MAAVPSSLCELVKELAQRNVRMQNPLFVERAIRTMMKDAQHKLQVVADFDRTLTKYIDSDGRECSTTHGVIEESEYMPESFKTEARKLKEYYLPIEFDHSRSVEEKIPKMIEWWSKGHALFVSSGLTRDKLSLIVSKSNARLRTNCDWLFDKLNELEIPLLVFSAGIGDVIKETITQQATYHSNIKLVSNNINFDENGKMVGFTGNDVIHTFNKNENSVLNSDYFDKIKHRSNILLLGDALGDIHMAIGADNMESLLKIGFLNFESEKNLPVYLENFDIVIIEDHTMDVVNAIIRAIEKDKTSS